MQRSPTSAGKVNTMHPRPPIGAGNAGKKVATTSVPNETKRALAREIHLDGLVVLKIVKNAHESADSGVLLGLDKGQHLEVTNCFPSHPEDRRQEKYKTEMLKLLREVRVDHYTIGWYQSCPLNTFCTERFVRTQYKTQEETTGAIAIIYDPTSASLGSLCLKVSNFSRSVVPLLFGYDYNFRLKLGCESPMWS